MANGDDLLHFTKCAQWDNQCKHHAKPTEDCARDKVRRENRRVPAGQLRHGKVERNDRVHRKHQRRGEASQQQIGLFIDAPVTVAACPPQRKEAVKHLLDLVGEPGQWLRDLFRLETEPVAHGSEVGDEPHVPEEHGHGEIGRDRKHIPQERRAELRPDVIRVGDR